MKAIDKDYKIHDIAELHNSHSGCIFIWHKLIDAYLEGNVLRVLRGSVREEELRNLYTDPRLERFERIALASTYGIIESSKYMDASKALLDFECKYDQEGYSHCRTIARILEDRSTIHEVGVCFWGTTVADDPWSPWDYKNNCYREFDFKKDPHFFIFQDMEERGL
jgi:hypothetical protein